MDDSERRKAIELLKEMRNENNADYGKSSNQESHLNWMYKGLSDLVDREEYLLGRTIDKNFEVLNSGGSSDVLGRTGEQSNVPKRLLEKTVSTEQVDIDKKILEDPLYAIKQKEMEARKKLLNNPVKLKQIKQLILERIKQSSAHKKKKKFKKKSEEHLNLLILKKLKKFTDKEKRKALNKIMQSDSSSSENSTSHSKKDKKAKAKRKRSSSSSSESDSSSSESKDSLDENEKESKYKKKKGKHKKKVRNDKNKSSSDSDSSNNKRREKSLKVKKTGQKKHSRESSSSSDNSTKGRKSESKSHNWKSGFTEEENRKSKKRSRSKEREENHGRSRKMKKNDDYSTRKSSKKPYGLMMPDGSKPEMKRKDSPVRKYEKKIESKPKYVSQPKAKPMTEKERKEKLKEMMTDAQHRKEERERNLASHRKKLSQEEEVKTYDDDFMRRQMSHLTSQGTMADRIKSNINNIQRSKSSMDSNFMQK